MKLFFILLIPFYLSSCTAFFPQPKQALSQDQQNFCLGFEEFQQNHRLDGLRKLRTDYPDSAWAARAETIILYAQELDLRKDQIKNLHESEQQQALEIEQLKKQNQQLTQKMEQLKSLLIQSEQHPQ